MNGGDILSMARQAGFVVKHDDQLLPMLKALAYLVAKHALDEAAQADSVKRIRSLGDVDDVVMSHERILNAARQGLVRLVVKPGLVHSASDGQTSRIKIGDLLHLYRIPGGVKFSVHPQTWSFARERVGAPGDILLEPRDDGDYSLESAAKRAGVSL